MAVTNEQVAAYLASNPNLSDAQIVSAMAEFNVTPAQMAAVTGIPEGEVVSRIAETLPPGQAAFLGGTVIQPVYDSTGQGETFQQGPLKEVLTYKQGQQTGDAYNQYSPTGELVRKGQFKDTGNFGDLLKDAYTAVGPIAMAALTAGGAGGLLGSSLGLTGTTASTVGGALLGGGNAALTGGNVLKGAVLGGAGGYLQGAGNVGTSIETDASFLANDAAQLAKAGLSEAQISQVLGASGYASGAAANLAASMAVNGLDVTTMTNQLNNLSTNTGLMSQTGSAADFAAADALQLRDQVGNNFAAIEQNLIASGVDPLIAADISQQIAFNPNLTQADLATNLANSFGDNIYDVDTASTYLTSVLSGNGGLLSDIITTKGIGTGTDTVIDTGTGTGTDTVIDTGTGTGTDTVIDTGTGTVINTDILKTLLNTGLVLGGTKTISGTGGNKGTTLQTPTQGVPTNDPNYYNQLQQYYNAYLPQTPRDVVTPLQQWYNAKSGA